MAYNYSTKQSLADSVGDLPSLAETGVQLDASVLEDQQTWEET
jgi:hypothetical protein